MTDCHQPFLLCQALQKQS
jgi:hypothetical protein